MSDKEEVIKLFDKLGIEWSHKCYYGEEDNNKVYLIVGRKKIEGYSGFVADFSFDNNGNFIDVGIWE